MPAHDGLQTRDAVLPTRQPIVEQDHVDATSIEAAPTLLPARRAFHPEARGAQGVRQERLYLLLILDHQHGVVHTALAAPPRRRRSQRDTHHEDDEVGPDHHGEPTHDPEPDWSPLDRHLHKKQHRGGDQMNLQPGRRQHERIDEHQEGTEDRDP